MYRTVVRVCFFLLSPPTKQCNRDVIMRAVTIWGHERSEEIVKEVCTVSSIVLLLFLLGHDIFTCNKVKAGACANASPFSGDF